MMTIIEFLGGPGVGKTTAAVSLFAALKREGIACEFTREYAQEAIFAGQRHHLESQATVAVKQYGKYKDLERAGIPLVISDTSLSLCRVYGDLLGERTGEREEILRNMVKSFESEFNILKVRVLRGPGLTYQTVGRVHTEAQATEVDNKIDSLHILYDYYINLNIIDEFIDVVILRHKEGSLTEID